MYQGSHLVINALENEICELVFDLDNSRVNIFNSQTVAQLSEALTYLEQASAVKGLLIRSNKPGFIAGADIGEFAPTFLEGKEKIAQLLAKSNSNFNRIEALPFPVVAAINGFALGGGCELALACDYRVAGEDVRIGLPETRLGIIPGWGGTVRLPRIAGVETAVEWIAGGKENSGVAAMKAGVLDAVVANEKLISAALSTLLECVDGRLDYKARRRQKQSPLKHTSVEKNLAFLTSKAVVAAQATKHYPAPLAAVKAMEKAAHQSAVEALALESETFIAMAQTPVALALSGIFINDQLLMKKAKTLAKKSPVEIKQAGVLGAGIMGGGIAYQSALKKTPIKMKDVAQAGLDLGLSEANTLLTKRVERGRLSTHEMGEVLNRIEPCLSYEGFDKVDIVVEAVVENPSIKTAVLSEVENHLKPDAILTSNTSTISISFLANQLKRPENFCGMHFFNPVHAMPLVEVIRTEKTSEATIAATVAYAIAMGKKPVVVKDCPGFLVNRVLFPYFAGFSMLVRDGVDFRQIDRVMEAWGWPMGPAYLLDVVGIDTGVHAAEVMAQGFPSRMGQDYKGAAEILLAAGRLGQKNKKGFYDYALDKKGRLAKTPESLTASGADELVNNGTKTQLSDDEILWRMMIPMATELARCLEEGIVDSPAEADMALIYGLGFPPFRGGVFRWLDTLGMDQFCQQSKAYQQLGELYQITPGMGQLADSQGSYYTIQGGQ